MIVTTYVLAHFFMLLLSGCWWDDWTFMSHNLDYVNAVASQSGRPEWNILVPLCWSIPNNGRPLIFVLYLFISIFVYQILKNSYLFNDRESLIITLLFTVVPVDEARILISNFAYTVGLFFFYLSFMLFLKWNKSDKKILYRILLLVLFFISFILNSVLAYYYIVMAYLLLLDFMRNKEKNIFKRLFISIKNVLVNYPDFFVLPFVYYFFNKTFFPTYGEVFGDYNSPSLMGLINSFIYIPVSIVSITLDIVGKFISCMNIWTIILMLVTIVYACISKQDNKRYSMFRTFKYFCYGLLVIVMGLFPYVMVRGNVINSMGVKGRDAVLVPLGFALLCFAVLSFFRSQARKTIFYVLIIGGILCLNSLYIEWQKDYYYQLSLENLLINETIKNNDTFFLTDLNESEIEGQRYYSLNANASNVYKDESRLFIPKVSNLPIIESKENMKTAKEELNYAHVMRDYNPDDLYFDAVLDYTNDLSWYDVVEYKYLEMFNNSLFNEKINENGKLDVYIVDDDFTKLLIDEYNNGNVHNDYDVLQLLWEYKK